MNTWVDSVQFSWSVMSGSLWLHGLKHVGPPCSSLTSGACSNSSRLSQWCHPTISSSVVDWVSDAIQPSHPLSSPSPPAFNLAHHQGLFQWVTSSHQVAKVWSFSFSISPSNEYLGLISCRMDWLDLLSVQGTLKSLLQYHGSKASILQCSALFMVQFSHPYVTTGKIIPFNLALIILGVCVCSVMSNSTVHGL